MAVLMVLDTTSLYKVLSWTFMWLIRPEFAVLELEYKKKKKVIGILGREQTIYSLRT